MGDNVTVVLEGEPDVCAGFLRRVRQYESVAAATRAFARAYESVDCGQEELCLGFLNAALDELDKEE